jgi:hypothetical protein
VRIDRLIVVVQTQGPIETNGSLLLSGMIEMGGKSCPREEAAAVEDVKLAAAVEVIVGLPLSD